MPSSSKIYPLSEAAVITADLGITVLGSGSAGTRNAMRRLIHPDPDFPPIVYFSNPDRTFNLDNDVLPTPRVGAFRGLEDTTLVRFEDEISDVIVTEIWTAIQGNRYSMPTFFFRQLYEYLINEPVYEVASPNYIQWEPRERNAFTYNIEIMRLTVGGGGQNNQLFDIADIKQKGGKYDPDVVATIKNSSDDLNTVETGVLDRTVLFQFKIVSKET